MQMHKSLNLERLQLLWKNYCYEHDLNNLAAIQIGIKALRPANADGGKANYLNTLIFYHGGYIILRRNNYALLDQARMI